MLKFKQLTISSKEIGIISSNKDMTIEANSGSIDNQIFIAIWKWWWLENI